MVIPDFLQSKNYQTPTFKNRFIESLWEYAKILAEKEGNNSHENAREIMGKLIEKLSKGPNEEFIINFIEQTQDSLAFNLRNFSGLKKNDWESH